MVSLWPLFVLSPSTCLLRARSTRGSSLHPSYRRAASGRIPTCFSFLAKGISAELLQQISLWIVSCLVLVLWCQILPLPLPALFAQVSNSRVFFLPRFLPPKLTQISPAYRAQQFCRSAYVPFDNNPSFITLTGMMRACHLKMLRICEMRAHPWSLDTAESKWLKPTNFFPWLYNIPFLLRGKKNSIKRTLANAFFERSQPSVVVYVLCMEKMRGLSPTNAKSYTVEDFSLTVYKLLG